MAAQNVDAPGASANPCCPSHPRIILPHLIACPLCAQEGRRATYARTRVEMAVRLAEALERLPRLVVEAAD
jgi:hypothetical protein